MYLIFNLYLHLGFVIMAAVSKVSLIVPAALQICVKITIQIVFLSVNYMMMMIRY